MTSQSIKVESKLYPPLPVHEQIRKPLQWKKQYLLSSDDIKEFSKKMKKRGGRPKKGITPIHIKVVSSLEKIEWASCMDLSMEINSPRKAIQDVVRVLYAKKILHRRRRKSHEYEYSLAELPRGERNEN